MGRGIKRRGTGVGIQNMGLNIRVTGLGHMELGVGCQRHWPWHRRCGVRCQRHEPVAYGMWDYMSETLAWDIGAGLDDRDTALGIWEAVSGIRGTGFGIYDMGLDDTCTDLGI